MSKSPTAHSLGGIPVSKVDPLAARRIQRAAKEALRLAKEAEAKKAAAATK